MKTTKHCRIVNTSSTDDAGFTLVELLVALSIFALLAVIGWQVFDQVSRSSAQISAQSERLSNLQWAHQQLQTDLLHVVPRYYQTDDTDQPSLSLSTNSLSFNRLSALDPRLKISPPVERVTYRVIENRLERHATHQPASTAEKPVYHTVLDEVDEFKFLALDPGELAVWPPLEQLSTVGQLAREDTANTRMLQHPMGISISFEYDGLPITWRFTLPPVQLRQDGQFNDSEPPRTGGEEGDDLP